MSRLARALLKEDAEEIDTMNTPKKNAKTAAPALDARALLTLTVRTGVQAGMTEEASKLGREQAKKLG